MTEDSNHIQQGLSAIQVARDSPDGTPAHDGVMIALGAQYIRDHHIQTSDDPVTRRDQALQYGGLSATRILDQVKNQGTDSLSPDSKAMLTRLGEQREAELRQSGITLQQGLSAIQVARDSPYGTPAHDGVMIALGAQYIKDHHIQTSDDPVTRRDQALQYGGLSATQILDQVKNQGAASLDPNTKKLLETIGATAQNNNISHGQWERPSGAIVSYGAPLGALVSLDAPKTIPNLTQTFAAVERADQYAVRGPLVTSLQPQAPPTEVSRPPPALASGQKLG